MANTISPRRRRYQYVGRWPDIHVLMAAVSDRLGPVYQLHIIRYATISFSEF